MPLTLEEHLFGPGPKRVLALDGGGVKGIITIAFLEKIEEILRERSGRGKDFRLCEYFDLVGGTSVGSLLATLIALGHSMAEIRTMFEDWTPQIFRHSRWAIPVLSPRFSSRGLRRRAKELLGEQTLEDNDLKTGLAIVTKRIDTGSPWVLSNNPHAKYWNDPEDFKHLGNRHFRIADLVCASTAAPYYFAPKRIRMVPKTTRPQEVGLFVDGGVSPYNNPALMLFMMAGIKGYNFNWNLGAENLFIVSVGTGSYRMGLTPNWLMRWFPPYFAVKAIHGLAADCDQLSLILLQWLSRPGRPWLINSELGTMEGELLAAAGGRADPLLSFMRYDSKLDVNWLRESLERTFSHGFIEGIKRLDRPDMMRNMYEVGEGVAASQVQAADFLDRFDPTREANDRPPLRGKGRGFAAFTLETRGPMRRKRLIAHRQLTPEDFRAIAVKLGTRPSEARRVGLLAARQSTVSEQVETRWNAGESRDTAAPGDWVVTNLTTQGRVLRDKAGQPNTYVIRGERFPELYDRQEGETEFGAIFKPKGTVQVLYLSGGFELAAPWGEAQQSDQGYVVLNGKEVYGNNRATFAATYALG